MDKAKEIFTLEEKLENLRDKLNMEAVKILRDSSKEEYKDLVDLSKELDDVIVNFIKNSVNKSKSIMKE
ncbi:hypothetical protein CLPUN_04140 [Clostridium puniceum]|uniref:Spo0E like sporulation regulatory protein n=1 Tax=Clostridium puniceum TaxID=29367 RepID=A0A1S8TXY7_9CLOT|nr:hypothetical protein [Clostridium puniceum]OOM82275.1 hypothetical protein CLPUN_04140 [Clostridium puniceum]